MPSVRPKMPMKNKKSDSALGLLGVGALLVGGFMVLGGVASLAMWVAGDAYFELLASVQSGPAEVSSRLYEELAAIQRRWSSWSTWLGAASIPVGLVLLHGGIQLLGKKSQALGRLQWAFGVALLLDVVGLYPEVRTHLETIDATQRFSQELGDVMSERMAEVASEAETIMKLTTNLTANSQTTALVGGLLVVLCKTACVVAALIFIHRRRSRPGLTSST